MRKFLRDRFSLHEDSAHDAEIIESISKNVEFRGSNLWALIFAIFIASIGLNVNSTAVIIGAMLVSPLMGPIMGLGLGIGINDVALIRKAMKNLLIAVTISVAVSALYFLLTPLHDAQSELLARTTPSIWDVFIALFGGLAGIVGSTRKEKGNVIPGVAIATALMPPLCTAGYGLSIGNIYYFLGAFYLFFINSVFICLSTFVLVRYMNLPRKTLGDESKEKKVMRYILYVVIATALPSIYLTYNIVKKSVFEGNSNNFIRREFNFPGTHVVAKVFKYETNSKTIDVLLLGDEIPDTTIDGLRRKLPLYKLYGVTLNVRQGVNSKMKIDYSQIKESIINDLFAKQEETRNNKKENEISETSDKIRSEMKALYPDLVSFSIGKQVIYGMDSLKQDTVTIFIGTFAHNVGIETRRQLRNWLCNRARTDSVLIVIQTKDHSIKR